MIYSVPRNISIQQFTTYRPVIPIIPTQGEGESRVNKTLRESDVAAGNWEICNLAKSFSDDFEVFAHFCFHTISPRDTMTAKQMEPTVAYPSNRPMGPPFANEVAVPSYT